MSDALPVSRREWEVSDSELVALARTASTWIDASKTAWPTTEFLVGIGRWVLDELARSPIRDDRTGQMPVVYLRVNSS